MMPHKYIEIEKNLPKNTNGKVNRNILKKIIMIENKVKIELKKILPRSKFNQKKLISEEF